MTYQARHALRERPARRRSAPAPAFAYVESDVPAGMTLTQWSAPGPESVPSISPIAISARLGSGYLDDEAHAAVRE